MSEQMPKLQAGQKLWWVRSMRYGSGPAEGCEVIVEKVGRKWAELDNRDRISLETWYADGRGYAPPGRCYLSNGAYQGELAYNKLREEFCNAVQRTGVRECTAIQIKQAVEILGLDLEKYGSRY